MFRNNKIIPEEKLIMGIFKMSNNHGNLFNNKKESEKQPDFTGKVNIEGKMFRIAGWERIGKKGKYISLCFEDIGKYTAGFAKKTTEKEQQSHLPPSVDGEPDDQIPF